MRLSPAFHGACGALASTLLHAYCTATLSSGLHSHRHLRAAASPCMRLLCATWLALAASLC